MRDTQSQNAAEPEEMEKSVDSLGTKDGGLETNEPLAPKDNPPIDNWNEEYPDVQDLEEEAETEIDKVGSEEIESADDNEEEDD